MGRNGGRREERRWVEMEGEWSLYWNFITIYSARNRVWIVLSYRTARGNIFKLLRSPGIDYASLRSVAGRYDKPIPTWFLSPIHCKKELAIFPSPAGMSLTKLSLGGKKLNYSRPGRVWSVTSRLGTGKRPTLFYSVDCSKIPAQAA